MTHATMTIGICVAVLLSYWFLYVGKRFRLSSVVLLLFAGIATRAVAHSMGHDIAAPHPLLPMLGTIGIVLIVLEGTLDLELDASHRSLLLHTFSTAALGLVLTVLFVAGGLMLFGHLPFLTAALVATPFAVISSAVAIPSAEALEETERAFVIYESSWSDILGVMLFNGLLMAHHGHGTPLNLVGGAVAILVLGVLMGLAMYWLVGHLEEHVKFLPIIFALLLVYAGAEQLGLSPLLIVLILGIMLNNPHLIHHFRFLERLHSSHYAAELTRLKHLTAEATFLVRSFFFLLLGYVANPKAFLNIQAWVVAGALVCSILGVRWVLLALMGKRGNKALLWTAPRGLVTATLFLSIPADMLPDSIPRATLLLVVVLTCLVMMAGLKFDNSTGE